MAIVASSGHKQTYEPISTISIQSDSSSIVFNNIPSTYTDLIAQISYANSTASYGIGVQFNLDTASNYSETFLYGTGTSALFARYSSQTWAYLNAYGVTATTTIATPAIVNATFFNYSNTNINKSFLSASSGSGAAGNGLDRVVGLWRSTAAINSITFLAAPSGNLKSGTIISLYGMKAA